VTDEKVCRVGCGEARLARHAGMCALFRAARKFDFAVGRKARCVCVCVCVCGGEGKSDVSPVGRKENRTRRAPLASISVNRQTLESSARVFARECASVRVRGENIPVKEDRKGCVDPKQPGCAGSTPPSMAGARFRKRVRVRGYIDGSRISNGYHTNKSDRLGAGKMYARLRPWHRKGVRAWAVCVTSP